MVCGRICIEPDRCCRKGINPLFDTILKSRVFIDTAFLYAAISNFSIQARLVAFVCFASSFAPCAVARSFPYEGYGRAVSNRLAVVTVGLRSGCL